MTLTSEFSEKGSGQRVIAVSVAQPRWHDMFGRQVLSSIVREPSTEPIFFGLDGPAGNSTAVHTEQVYAFFAEHYQLWTSRLRLNRAKWKDCHWGENLMLQGLSEDRLHIGDQFAIGQAVLEVTSPRIPCFKLCWRIGQSENYLQTLIDDGRTGCYFRVLQPGLIGPGDQLRAVAAFPDRITVLDLSRLLFDPSIEDLAVLRRILAIPSLGDQASGMIRKRISHLTDERLNGRGRWQGWRSFSVNRTRAESATVQSFFLRPADGDPIAGYRAGQSLTVKLIEAPGQPVRSWSISDYDQASDAYRISVRDNGEGTASGYMHQYAEAGTRLEVRPPAGDFVIDRSGFMRVVLISAGIGVTPLLAMLKAHSERGDEAPPLIWLQCVRSGAEHPFAEEVSSLLSGLYGATRRIHYSNPGKGDLIGIDFDRVGRVDRTAVEEIVIGKYKLNPFGREIELNGDNSEFYVCGPLRFEQTIRDALLQLGVKSEHIHSESFAQSNTGNRPATPERAIVNFSRSNVEALWLEEDNVTLLELAERCGIPVNSSCASGSCGTCAVRISSGSTATTIANAIDPGPDWTLLCCALPMSDRIDLEI